MTMPLQHSEEALHEAYVYAVAAKAGVNVKRPDRDYGIDLTFSQVQRLSNGSYSATGHDMHCQLKARSTAVLRGDHLVCDIEAKTYNTLVQWSPNATPCILIVFFLPKNDCDWLFVNEDHLRMHSCCYWIRLAGTAVDNTSTKSIQIPRTNIFTPEALTELMVKVRRGDEL